MFYTQNYFLNLKERPHISHFLIKLNQQTHFYKENNELFYTGFSRQIFECICLLEGKNDLR